ncbi:MAG: TetR/AcrR family transcriptional regulator [Janthinobacterium lividum]
MPKQSRPATVARRPRVDAQRNRERILEVAREAFTQHGPEATLDDIARRAEIGPGTLYRHFPTRDALIEAVFRSEVEKLTAAGERYTVTLRPLDALRAWMLVFIDYVAGKTLILPAMDTVPGGSMRLIEGTRGLIHSTFRGLVQRAVDSGDFRAGTDPDDIIRALIGVFHTTSLPGWESSARRIVDILIDGSRPRG